MRDLIALLILTLTLPSCSDSVIINKQLETKTNHVTIKTTVDFYSPSDQGFYGVIEMCNLRKDTIRFNFNQLLFVENVPIQADWKLLPVSWACQAFEVLPNERVKWKVFWQVKNKIKTFDKIYIKPDTRVVKANCKLSLSIDTLDI